MFSNHSPYMFRFYWLLLFCFITSISHADKRIWLLVDTHALKMEVKMGGKTVDRFDNISIGRGGAGFKEQQGDDITPLGTYKIGWINTESPFHLFFGFDYPAQHNAEQALVDGLISRKAYKNIVTAHQRHRLPPQNTALGGRIGIHGLGRADRKIHKIMNWTHGCIALTNAQIDRLSRWISKGTTVKVK